MTNTKRVVMLFTGMGLGAAGALLLAPEPGDRTRRRIRKNVGKANEYVREQAEVIGDTVAKGVDSVNQLTERVKDTVDDVTAAARKAADNLVDRSIDVVHDAGKKLAEGGKRLQRV
ncbi:MAG TPA: YtxH domain-containing protein [Bryobacteraceae bacterium]|nr:YtxH domain-containing protein [Bryobacteraceae bacterium]